MKISTVQIPNTLSVNENFKNIISSLNNIIEAQCELVVFPECSLSGFSAEIKKCTMIFLKPFLDQINEISNNHNLAIILPSAYVEDGKVYNAVFIFDSNHMHIQYKIGLTESEKKFFSIPEKIQPKIISIKGIRIAILICVEAQMPPYSFFNDGEIDLIIWPGYISSGEKSDWNDLEKNEVYTNMLEWKTPLIQSNFSFNDSSVGGNRGPDGHSIVLNKHNKLLYRGKYQGNDIIIVNLNELN